MHIFSGSTFDLIKAKKLLGTKLDWDTIKLTPFKDKIQPA